MPREGTWAAVGRTFEPVLDLGNKQALGVWVCGDGSGALLDFRVTTRLPHWGMCSHYVPLDFIGWRYVELVEAESTRSSDYIWPEQGGYFVYDHYRAVAAYNRISSFEVWLNNLPANQDVSCKIGPVRALETTVKKIRNPSVTVNGAALTFPVEMESGMYLELEEGGKCRLYDKDGKTVRDLALQGAVPLLKNGRNEVSFACDGDGPEDARVQVTLIGEKTGGDGVGETVGSNP